MSNTRFHEFEPIRSSVSILVLRLFLILFLIDTLYSSLTFFLFRLPSLQDWHYELIGVLFITHFLKNLLSVFFVLKIVLTWVSTIYYVTDKYIMKHEGIFSLREKIYDLKHVLSVTVQQDMIAKIFNYGDIHIRTSGLGSTTEDIYITGVSNPEKYREIFKHCLEVNNSVVS